MEEPAINQKVLKNSYLIENQNVPSTIETNNSYNINTDIRNKIVTAYDNGNNSGGNNNGDNNNGNKHSLNTITTENKTSNNNVIFEFEASYNSKKDSSDNLNVGDIPKLHSSQRKNFTKNSQSTQEKRKFPTTNVKDPHLEWSSDSLSSTSSSEDLKLVSDNLADTLEASEESIPSVEDIPYEGESSDYTDARSSLSAPIELLSEFLSAVMSRHYDEALKLCHTILKYEPDNATAKEFLPLILQKLQHYDSDYSDHSTDEGNESDEGTTDSYSSLENDEDDYGNDFNFDPEFDEDDEMQGCFFKQLFNRMKPRSFAETSNAGNQNEIYKQPRGRNDPVWTSNVNQENVINKLSTTKGIHSENVDFPEKAESSDSMFSSTDSDLTLEAVIHKTHQVKL